MKAKTSAFHTDENIKMIKNVDLDVTLRERPPVRSGASSSFSRIEPS